MTDTRLPYHLIRAAANHFHVNMDQVDTIFFPVKENGVYEVHVFKQGTTDPVIKGFGINEAEAIVDLERNVREAVLLEHGATFYQALTYDQRKVLKVLATSLLKFEHEVFLGTKGSSVSDMAASLGAREYSDRVARYVDDLKLDMTNNQITSSDALQEQIHEIEVVYTRDAMEVLLHSNNDEAYADVTGDDIPEWETLASYALQADVTEALQRDGVDVSAIEERECLRCGNVVTWTPDAEECPKCALDFATEELAGGYDHDGVECCSDCVGEEEMEAKMPKDTVYSCGRCRGAYYTGRP